jgi:signal transduction histidine kinase
MTPVHPAESARLLAVDDREENLIALEALLRQEGVVVDAVGSGREALDALLRNDYALAIVDVQMPEMDGFELARLMRGVERTRRVPIIFVTAGGAAARLGEGYEAGAVDFLLKPIDPHVLRSKVQVFLELYRARRELAWSVKEREDAEAALREASRRKDEFLAVLSHELRNPLAPIRNGLFILARAEPGSEQARRAQAIIERQVAHVTRLVDDLLDVSRVSRGKIELKRARVDLADLVRRAAEDHRSILANAGVALDVVVPPEETWVDGDPVRLAQIVANLLQNAAKFTRRGGHVRVALELEGREARVRVRDTGVGIDPAMLEHIFEPFTQGEQPLARSHGGLGLGLSLARSLAQLHGGGVDASSGGEGKGAELLVRLPIAPVADAARGSDDQAEAQEPRRVLVIEDNVDGADTLRDVLELDRHEVRVAHDGLAGVAAAREFLPDVVLCDIGLPGIDGYEVARRIRSDPALRGASLVAVTGYALAEDRERARAAGFDAHLAKPLSPDALRAAIARR